MAEKIERTITPSLLREGDTVALAAPARSTSREELKGFFNWASSKNLKVVESPYLYHSFNQFSAEDHLRAEGLNQLLSSNEVKAIFCARGGYGSVRLLPYLSIQGIIEHPKWLIGYSDITMLHLFWSHLGLKTIHAPVAINFHQAPHHFHESIQILEQALFEGALTYSAEVLTILNNRKFEGDLIGGNLSLIYASLGTPEQPETINKVLILEDIDEYLYHIDRMLVALDRAGIFQSLSGLIIGDFTDLKDHEKPFGESVQDMVTRICSSYGYPIIFGFPFGHGKKNYSLYMNSKLIFDGKTIKQNSH